MDMQVGHHADSNMRLVSRKFGVNACKYDMIVDCGGVKTYRIASSTDQRREREQQRSCEIQGLLRWPDRLQRWIEPSLSPWCFRAVKLAGVRWCLVPSAEIWASPASPPALCTGAPAIRRNQAMQGRRTSLRQNGAPWPKVFSFVLYPPLPPLSFPLVQTHHN